MGKKKKIYNTYKELKQYQPVNFDTLYPRFIIPIRNWNRSISVAVAALLKIYNTYKELKLLVLSGKYMSLSKIYNTYKELKRDTYIY